MKFEFKQVPVPKAAKKRLPKDRRSANAFKVRRDKEVVGTVVTFVTLGGQTGWGYVKAGGFYGGCTDCQDAAEKLASS